MQSEYIVPFLLPHITKLFLLTVILMRAQEHPFSLLLFYYYQNSFRMANPDERKSEDMLCYCLDGMY